ncbi:MAG TPA: hypothetical protein VGM22_24230 [Methylomirabilota bacterium]
MANQKGSGLLMVWADVPADKEPDFNRWYNEEHLAERLAIPGFLSGARYEAVKGGPKHLAVYELESPAVMESPAYKKVQANPTPWTQRSGPQAVATTFIRNIYTMIHPRALSTPVAASGMAPALQIGRMDVPAAAEAEWNTWYNTIYVPNYEKVPGVIRGRRYRAVVGTPTYMTFYEFEHPKVSESAAWMAQRDAVPASTTMRNHMKHAPGSPGVYVKTFELPGRK